MSEPKDLLLDRGLHYGITLYVTCLIGCVTVTLVHAHRWAEDNLRMYMVP